MIVWRSGVGAPGFYPISTPSFLQGPASRILAMHPTCPHIQAEEVTVSRFHVAVPRLGSDDSLTVTGDVT